MNNLFIAVSAIAVLSCLASVPSAAQQVGVGPAPQSHAVNPTMSLSAPTNSPLQAQMRENYAASLRGRAARSAAAEPVGPDAGRADDRP